MIILTQAHGTNLNTRRVASEASCCGNPPGPGSLRVGLLDELHKGVKSGACLGVSLQLL